MTSASSKTVTIFGATGAQGAPVVTEAIAQGHSVRAVARNADKIRNLHPEAEAVSADLADESSLIAALDGSDAAFLHFPRPEGADDNQTWAGAFFAAAHKVQLPLLVYVTGAPTGDRFPSSTIVNAATQGMQAVLQSGIPSVVLQSAVYLENLIPEVFLPNLRSEGKLDYPPVARDLKFQWTSHIDQATLAVAALSRPDLAGRSFEIGTPGALTGDQLSELLSAWLGRDVAFDPMTPADFGQRIADAFNSETTGFALSDLYGAIAKLSGNDMVIDSSELEKTFNVKLTSVADHIKAWPQQ